MSSLRPDDPRLLSLPTPCAMIDVAALTRNIDTMAFHARQAGIALRPHAKTHKCAEIARLQLEAGAVGIACATIGEAEALADASVGPLMITSPLAGDEKYARAVQLGERVDLTLTLDHQDHLAQIEAVKSRNARPISVVVELDVGQGRSGTQSVAAAISLAERAVFSPAVVFCGIQGFSGQVQHIADHDAREAGARQVADTLRQTLTGLRQAGITADIVTGSGTGTFGFDCAGPFNEVQVGSYVFMDADYRRITDKGGGALPYEQSLFILTTVVSANREGQVTVDAGTKAVAFNGPVPDMILGAPNGSSYHFAGDEHGVVRLPRGRKPPRLGSRLLLAATHCDPTANLYGHYIALSGKSAEKWHVLGRH
ncbi:DSD1 family PLP-dependent enzyme [Shinella zoogloeoides]